MNVTLLKIVSINISTTNGQIGYDKIVINSFDIQLLGIIYQNKNAVKARLKHICYLHYSKVALGPL